MRTQCCHRVREFSPGNEREVVGDFKTVTKLAGPTVPQRANLFGRGYDLVAGANVVC